MRISEDADPGVHPLPPASWTRGGRLRGLIALEELPNAAGMELWHLLRSAQLWAEATEEQRAELFQTVVLRRRNAALRAAEMDPALRSALTHLARTLYNRTEVTPERIAAACRRVAEWADEQEKLGTALAFMQTAARADPADAQIAYEAGRLARKRAEYLLAETWLTRAVDLGRVNGQWEAHARAFIGLGNLHFQRGNFPKARLFHAQALQVARQLGLREVEGKAAHDLFVVADESGRFPEAEIYATEALQAYGPGHPRLPFLAHDVASSWVNQGRFAHAIPVAQSVLLHMHTKTERLIALGTLARAAGATGLHHIFAEAWKELVAIVHHDSGLPGAAQALIDAARGAASLREWELADFAANLSAKIASERNEAQIKVLAESVQEAILQHRRFDESPRRETRAQHAQADVVAADFTAALQQSAAVPV